MLNRLNRTNPWRLRGTSSQVAAVVAAVLAAVAVAVAMIDLRSATGWDSPLLQAWTLIPQTFVAAGLVYLARARKSASFALLGFLVALIVVEEAFHVLNPLAARLARLASWANQWTDVRLALLNGVLIYGFVAAVGLSLLVVSHRRGSSDERPVVRNFALLLLAAGFFGGPISTLSTMGGRRRWIFIEEIGEAIVFAVLAGYVAGLVTAVYVRRSKPLAPQDRLRSE